MYIRKATPDDVPQIQQLYYDTVTTINTRDYTPDQIQLWSASAWKTTLWQQKIAQQHFFVAQDPASDQLLGFSSITDEGYLDFMYVHRHFQGQGIATALLQQVETVAWTRGLSQIWAKVSITARPFFRSHGFEITKVYTATFANSTVTFEDAIMTKYAPPATPSYLLQTEQLLTQYPLLYPKIMAATGLQRDAVPALLLETLRFLHLAATCRQSLTPSHIVDLAWHELILFTRLYADFCQQYWGKFLHHNPDGDEKANQTAFRRTHYWYTKVFAQTPPVQFWGQILSPIADNADCGVCNAD